MLRDSQKIIDVYRRYLEITGDLVTILERHYEKLDTDIELKEKRKEFVKHANKIIHIFNDDLHKLLKISFELRNIEKYNV